ADRRLYRNLEHVRRDQVLQLLHHRTATALRRGAVDQDRQRVDRLAIDQDRHLHEVARAVADQGVVERGIALGKRFQAVVEIEHHFIERQLILEHRPAADVGQANLYATAFL